MSVESLLERLREAMESSHGFRVMAPDKEPPVRISLDLADEIEKTLQAFVDLDPEHSSWDEDD